MPTGDKTREVWARLTPEQRAERARKCHTPEINAKRAASARTKEAREARAEIGRRLWRDPLYRERVLRVKHCGSKTNIAAVQTPEAREKARLGVLRALAIREERQAAIIADLEKMHGLTPRCRDMALVEDILAHYGVYVRRLSSATSVCRT